jgi:tetratricopeptide (TPR) repeat protein
MHITARVGSALLLVAVVAVLGCARSPEASKARHLSRADDYFDRQRFQEAIIEYMNVLRFDPANARAITRLAVAHFETAQLGRAFPFLLKAKELDPGNLEVRTRLGAFYLLLRRLPEARAEAAAILEANPQHLEGLLLSAATATTSADVDAEIRRLETARGLYGDRAKLHTSLGILYLRKNAPEGAERAFQEAIAREPKSVETHLVLGDFYAGRRDAQRAEGAYRAAAALGPVGSLARLKLADFYFAMQRPDEGKRVLQEITGQAPDFLPGWRRLADVALVERRYDDALAALAPVFKKNAEDFEGRLLRGRIRLGRGETVEAIQDFQGVLKSEPSFVSGRYYLALAYVAAGNVQQAKSELKDITADFPDGVLLLADLHLQGGATDPAIDLLTRLVAKHPVFPAYVLLGSAYLRKNEPARAVSIFETIITRAPKDPRGPHLVGLALLAQGKRAEAKKRFEAALELAPNYIDPLAQLVDLALAERQPDAALERVERQMARVPKAGAIPYLLGRIHERRGQPQQAERAYLKALEVEPALVAPYVALGNVYTTSGNYDRALASIAEALKRRPRDVGAQMLEGVVYERKGDVAGAMKAYEKVLAVDSRFAPAANNLAYLYSEHGGDRNRALALAELAKEAAPDEPHISDTLGWILYKRGVYQRALALLKESAAKLPDNVEVQYHLGMTYAKLGDKANARQALSRAVASTTPFSGKDEARRLLGQL